MKTIDELQREKLEAEIQKLKEEAEQIRVTYSEKRNSNKDLDKDKLEAEIAKLKEETALIKKPWHSQPSFLSLIVSFSVPILSIVAAYFFGGGKEYFDAKTISLQNERHDLEEEVAEFKGRRDSLNKVNISLVSSNKQLMAESKGLQLDTLRLGNTVRGNSEKLVLYERDKRNYLLQINSLSSQKQNLNEQIQQKNRDLVQSSFKENFAKLVGIKEYYNLSINSTYFSGLLNAIKEGGEFQSEYINIIKNTIDTCTRLQLKAVLQALMYSYSYDPRWKTALFTTANKACDSIKVSRNIEFYWRIFDQIQWKDKTEKISVVQFLAECISKLQSNSFERSDIFIPIAFMEFNDSLELYRNLPNDFCFLLRTARQSISTQGSMVGNGSLIFLEYHAPIACVLIISEILKSNTRFASLSPFERSQLLGQIIGLIERNPDVFTSKPENVNSADSWRNWQQQYDFLLQLLDQISNGNCNETNTKKLVGRRIV